MFKVGKSVVRAQLSLQPTGLLHELIYVSLSRDKLSISTTVHACNNEMKKSLCHAYAKKFGVHTNTLLLIYSSFESSISTA